MCLLAVGEVEGIQVLVSRHSMEGGGEEVRDGRRQRQKLRRCPSHELRRPQHQEPGQ